MISDIQSIQVNCLIIGYLHGLTRGYGKLTFEHGLGEKVDNCKKFHIGYGLERVFYLY